MEFRTLEAHEIDCRINTVSEKGISLLLYKDARCDMNILDETVGAFNWQRSHSRDNANCTVSIWDVEKRQWISKEDTGTESFTEKSKGLASDSFKRACFNWGIGRELYTAPFIWIPVGKCKTTQKNGKWTCYDKFEVLEIGYDSYRNISYLRIANKDTGQIVYELREPSKKASEAQIKTIESICKAHKIDPGMLYSSNGLARANLTSEQAGQLLQSLKKKFGDE